MLCSKSPRRGTRSACLASIEAGGRLTQKRQYINIHPWPSLSYIYDPCYAPMTSRPLKLAFVTIGATASFPELIQACISPAFLRSLAQHEFTDLLIQYGKGGRQLLRSLLSSEAQPESRSNAWVASFMTAEGIRVAGFDFKKDGLALEMLATTGNAKGFEAEGVVISHAGASSA